MILGVKSVSHPDLVWQEDGACYEHGNTSIFFSLRANEKRQAKAICMSCKVRLTCLNYAIDTDIEDGIWGGMDRTERVRSLAMLSLFRSAKESVPLRG